MSFTDPLPAPPAPDSSKGGSERPPREGSEPASPAGSAPAARGKSDPTVQIRRHYGRRRGSVPIGDTFVARLGPVIDEPFAAIDDPDEPLRPRPGPETPIEELRFVAVDCETTGQSPHRMVEIGAVAFTLTGHLMSFETLVHSNDRINPYARRIHGISSETLGGAPPVRPVLERFQRFCRGAVLVEHSADAFDSRLIATTLGESLEADNLDTSSRPRRCRGHLGVLPGAGTTRTRALRLEDARGSPRRRPAPTTTLGGCRSGWPAQGRPGTPPPRRPPAPSQ
jgi:hypothetical protein